MKFLVTGHNGFIGSTIFNLLNKLKYETMGIDIKNGDNILDILNNKKAIKFKPDVILHLAALPRVQHSVENPSDTLENNVLGTSRILEFAKKVGTRRVVFSSSSAIYGDSGFPTNPYGLQKLLSEQECRLYNELYGVDIVCLRYFNVYSENQKVDCSYPTVISAWMNKIKNNQPCLIYGNGNNKRDYIHVDDIADANLFFALHTKDFNAECIDIGTGISYDLNYIKNYILSINSNIEFNNLSPRKGDPLSTLANLEKSNKFGWKSKIKFNNGLDRCFDFIKEDYK